MAIISSFPIHTRLVLISSIIGLILSLASFVFPTAPAGLLSFYFAFCWVLWIISALLSVGNKLVILAVSWNIINISILTMHLSVYSTLGVGSESQGAELVWFLCYLPLMLPTGYIYDSISTDVVVITDIFKSWFGTDIGRIVGDWLMFSIVAITQSLIILFLIWAGFKLFSLVQKRTKLTG